MAANFEATVDADGNVVIVSTNDGQEVKTSYLETSSGSGGVNSFSGTDQGTTTQDGSGRIITWSTPVQDGTRGLTGDRGPGTFNRAVSLVRPTTTLSQNLLSQGLVNGEVTEIFGNFSSADFNLEGTVEVGTNPVQTFTYTSKGTGDLSIIGPAGQLFTEVEEPAVVSGFSDAPEISTEQSARVTIGTTTVTLTYNQIAGQTICNDQLGDYTVVGATGSCSLDVGNPIPGDVVILTFLDSTELPGNTTTRAAIFNGDENATPSNINDDWTEFEFVIDGDLLVQGTVVAEALIIDGATLQSAPGGLGVLTVGQINAANINANAVTTAKLDAGAATFDKINLNGQLIVETDGSGAISWGKTGANDVNSGGLFMGNANATNTVSRFVLGNASSYMLFDGQNLSLVGVDIDVEANREPQVYSTAGTFDYTIAPEHDRLLLELSGAGGGGGGSSDSTILATGGGNSSLTVMRKLVLNGAVSYENRSGELVGGVNSPQGLTASISGGMTQQIFVTSVEGFTMAGNIELVTTSSADVELDRTIFNYDERRDEANNNTRLRVSVNGILSPVFELIVEDSSSWDAIGTVVFPDGEEFPYDSKDETGGLGAHKFVSNGGVNLVEHAGSLVDLNAELLEDINRTFSFFSNTAQPQGTHVIHTQSVPSATVITGNDHTFTTAGGAGGSSGTFSSVNGDGEVGDVFDARVQTGDSGPDEGNFRGDGGTAGDFDEGVNTKEGGIGGLGRGVEVKR